MRMSYWEMIRICEDTCLIPLFVSEGYEDPAEYYTLKGIRVEEAYNKKYSSYSTIDFDKIDDEELYNLMVDDIRYKLIFVQDSSLYSLDYRLTNIK
ncbi:MAG: hypothetical protein PHH29_17110 [Desulfuromonadaceae bacterium]|nr:hypothetical protein [Desulfuromonadaceae bacterium]